MNRIHAEGLQSLEQPFIKVPVEQFKKACRISQRIVENQLGTFVETLEKLEESKKSPDEILAALEEYHLRILALKQQLNSSKEQEEIYGSRTKKRLEHLSLLNTFESIESEDFIRWSRTRLQRILVDYMLRKGYSESAEKLATDSGVRDYVDLELFSSARIIENSIKSHSCVEALEWCQENKLHLAKTKAKFVELVRAGLLKEAIEYAKTYLILWSKTHLTEIQQAMALLAFTPNTSCGIYKSLFDARRWDKLVVEFQKNNNSLFNLTEQSLLDMNLQVGLSALKTAACYQTENQNMNCPVCLKDTFGKLAEGLPQAHHLNSCLVCRISGELMNENNPPLVMPNGNVYSSKALKEMASRKEGRVECPRTNAVFLLSECKKAYIS